VIRNSVKAIIISEGKILLTKNKDDDGDFYLLPGGGQEKFEDFHKALRRECLEEISCNIKINDIRFVREYIGKRHEFSESDNECHQIEYMFECSLADDAIACNGTVPDNFQTAIEWVALSQLKHIRLYPAVLKQVIHETGIFEDKIYLGVVN
jgi:8-oxo-dGTP pyrophosphatase MutT (NUDIX family)